MKKLKPYQWTALIFFGLILAALFWRDWFPASAVAGQ